MKKIKTGDLVRIRSIVKKGMLQGFLETDFVQGKGFTLTEFGSKQSYFMTVSEVKRVNKKTLTFVSNGTKFSITRL